MEAKKKTFYDLINRPCKILLADPQSNITSVLRGIILSIDGDRQQLTLQTQQHKMMISLSDIIALRPIN